VRSLAQRERADLADLLDEVGPDAPTLCEGWTSYDLAAHLVLRDAAPPALVGVVVPALERVTDRAMSWTRSRQEYGDLVRRLREGPPWYSPMRPSRIDRLANTLEFYIHHEDLRRGGGDHTPRELSAQDQGTLWAAIRRSGRILAHHAEIGIVLVRRDVPDSVRIHGGEPALRASGLPGELALFASGRGAAADVEMSGDPAAVEAFEHDQLGR
jgi:uncharacterized protein (TIGR03085 family)